MSDYDEWDDMSKTEVAVEKAAEALREAITQDIMTDDTVTSKQYNEMRWERDEAKRRVEELQKDYEELYRRCTGMTRHLTRIRNKADTASGYENESGGSDEATIKMRSAGAEGAVDRLITLYCGKLTKGRKSKWDA